MDAIHQRHAFARVRRQEDTGLGTLQCECVIPMAVEPVEPLVVKDVDVEWLIGNPPPTGDKFQLVTDVKAIPAGSAFAPALRLLPPDKWADPAELSYWRRHPA